jgi:hypothetical protein
MFKKLWFAGSFFMLLSSFALAKSYLFYLEAQGVAGYSSALKKGILYSLSQEDAMQKPSLGFDYIQRISGETRDYGALALQVRLAYNNEGSKKIELQVYNAYLRYKAGFSDLWIGHNRPAMGLSSTLDSHGLLLPTLAMTGFGFDREGFRLGEFGRLHLYRLRHAALFQRELPWRCARFKRSLKQGQLQPWILSGLWKNPGDHGLPPDVSRPGLLPNCWRRLDLSFEQFRK